jgi:signal transduction histidine kinase
MLLHRKSGKQGPFDKEKSGAYIVISIVIASYILFFTFQVTSEFATLNKVFSISREEQLVLTENLARIMSLKFNIVENILTEAATRNSTPGDVSTESLIMLIQQKLAANNLSEGQVIIINRDNRIIDTNTAASVSEFNIGDAVEYPWVMEVQNVYTPIFSSSITNGNEEEDDVKLFFAQPLFDQNGRYEGIVALILSSTFFTDEFYYLDVSQEVPAKEVAVLDDQLRYVLTSNKEHRGQLYGDDIKQILGGSDPVSFLRDARNSAGGDAIFHTEEGEFVVSGFPIYYYGSAEYFLVIESNVSSFYAEVEPILFQSRIQMFSILAATAILTVIIASFISRNINLDKQVRDKTKELLESNLTIDAQKKKLEKTNEELKHLDALKTQFIGIASHELKNPIQPIILYAEMAKYGDVDKDQAIEVILAQAQKLRQLSMDILEVSRIDSNNLILNRTKVKIGDLLQELIVPYQVDTNHEISFVLDVDQNTEMNIDVVRISQVINNILQNAIKFTRAGRITIKKRTLTDHSSDAMLQPMAEIVISDMGPGIPEDLLPKLFGKFVTQDIDGLNKHGSGLGLYISKAIIEAHGGRISAHNDEGAGASFRILLPI